MHSMKPKQLTAAERNRLRRLGKHCTHTKWRRDMQLSTKASDHARALAEAAAARLRRKRDKKYLRIVSYHKVGRLDPNAKYVLPIVYKKPVANQTTVPDSSWIKVPYKVHTIIDIPLQ